MKQQEQYKRDGRGMMLCIPCWNGQHYTKEIKDFHREFTEVPVGKNIHSECLQGECECPCVRLMLEKSPRVTAKDRKKFQEHHQAKLAL
jgi:hypothetical protein